MNLCVFSDIHGNQYAFNQFLRVTMELDIDYYVFCGDIFGYYYGQEEIVKHLIQIKNLLCVRGNHDQYILDIIKGKKDRYDLVRRYGASYNLKYSETILNYIETMPVYFELIIDFLKVGIFHGSPQNYLEGRIYPNSDFEKLSHKSCFLKYGLVITGHTHYRHFTKYNGIIFLNPGSIGQARDRFGSSFSIFNTITLENYFYHLSWDKKLLLGEIDKKDKLHKDFKNVFFREL